MKNLRNIVFDFALPFAPTIVSGQCDPDGVWLERQAYVFQQSAFGLFGLRKERYGNFPVTGFARHVAAG